jgi:hypothetical protein
MRNCPYPVVELYSLLLLIKVTSVNIFVVLMLFCVANVISEMQGYQLGYLQTFLTVSYNTFPLLYKVENV